jgi:hypothetical protein
VQIVFKNKKLQQSFLKNGYVVVKLIDHEDCQKLLDFYHQNPNLDKGEFHSTHFSTDRAYKKRVHQNISATYHKALEQYLENYKPIFANFMVKEAHENSIMPLHADWTYVNEDKSVSLGVWSPLMDTNLKNGMLGVVPKSHFFKKNPRGPQIPTPFHDFNEYIIDKYGKLLPIKAGEAVIYDHRLLHFSPPNLSSKTRVAVNIVMVPNNEKMIHYASFGDLEHVSVFQPKDESFYLEYDHFEKPTIGSPIKNIALKILPFEKKYIDRMLSENSIFTRLLNFWK